MIIQQDNLHLASDGNNALVRLDGLDSTEAGRYAFREPAIP